MLQQLHEERLELVQLRQSFDRSRKRLVDAGQCDWPDAAFYAAPAAVGSGGQRPRAQFDVMEEANLPQV